MRLPRPLLAITNMLDAIVHSTVDATAELAQHIEGIMADEAIHDTGTLLSATVHKQLRQSIKATLNKAPYGSGAGFASYIDSSPSQQPVWMLEWWYKHSDSEKPTQLTLDQATQQRLDFRTFDWFRHLPPAGEARIHGPYVDYVCNTAYTLTSARPVHHRGVLWGVAAIDLLVSRIETELLLCAGPQPFILTNHDDRIIVSTLPHYRVANLFHNATLTLRFQNAYFRLYTH